MFDHIFACLDGSAIAERILPLAQALRQPGDGKLTFLRVVQDSAEIAAEEDYWRDRTRQYRAELRLLIAADPAAAIAAELEREPKAIAALTTHGRTAWAEAVLGSVTLRVIRESKRPVIVFRPADNDGDVAPNITTVAAALDGSDFSEKILRHAVKATVSQSARLLLLQVLPVLPVMPPLDGAAKHDIAESSYLHRKAADIKAAHGIDAQWEVLHGDPADAIRRYLSDMPGTLLALTTHARGGLERLVLGSVAGACVRHVRVPLMLYWPNP